MEDKKFTLTITGIASEEKAMEIAENYAGSTMMWARDKEDGKGYAYPSDGKYPCTIEKED